MQNSNRKKVETKELVIKYIYISKSKTEKLRFLNTNPYPAGKKNKLRINI